MKDLPKEVKEKLELLAEEIRTQNNLYTANPIFEVQRKESYPTDDDYADGHIWYHRDDGEEITGLRAKRLEILYNNDRDFLSRYTDNFVERIPVLYKWVTVTSCFTRKGCEDYLKIEGHNIKGKTRIYVESAFRNNEYQFVREFLMNYF